MADLLIRERGGSVLLDASVTTTLAPATTVGENWVRRLLDRHPHLKTKYSRKYDYQRALCEDPQKISAWFARVQKTIAEFGILDSDIYNFDETGFQMGVASTSKVVTRSDRRNRPVVLQPGNREWATVIECINMTGWALDPMILFEGKVHISSWYEGSELPRTWRTALRHPKRITVAGNLVARLSLVPMSKNLVAGSRKGWWGHLTRRRQRSESARRQSAVFVAHLSTTPKNAPVAKDSNDIDCIANILSFVL
jgi:hypothetical protein